MQRARAQAAAEDAAVALREGIEANLDAEDLTALVRHAGSLHLAGICKALTALETYHAPHNVLVIHAAWPAGAHGVH